LLYPVLSKWHIANHDLNSASRYLDSSLVAINRYNEKFSALKVLRAQQKLERQNEELHAARLTLEKERKKTERKILFLLIFILCIVTVLTYFVQKKKQLANHLKLQAANQHLEVATVELNRFTENVREKNKLIEQLQRNNPEQEQEGIFAELQQSTILTEDEWQVFQTLFDKVHPGFIRKVREKNPSLSTGEVRYFVLCRLSIPAKDMASMLGVSSNAIHVMRHRIRKRLGLSEKTSLEEIAKMY
jgi:hypothetical protein